MTRRIMADGKGFTLIEVLIALSVLGVTMTAAFTLFSSGLKLRMVTQDRLAFDRDARLIMRTLQDDLANLVPYGPVPMVSFDSIVLWRQSYNLNSDNPDLVVPQLVTYQWSGSAAQDSMFVRMTTPLSVDTNNSKLVRQQFMKWARVYQLSNATTKHLVREGKNSRFGSQATLNGLSGSWISYPRVQGFACGITQELTENDNEQKRSRILIKLSPKKFEPAAPGMDSETKLALLPQDNVGVEMVLWLPLEAQTPVPNTDDPVSEVQP